MPRKTGAPVFAEDMVYDAEKIGDRLVLYLRNRGSVKVLWARITRIHALPPMAKRLASYIIYTIILLPISIVSMLTMSFYDPNYSLFLAYFTATLFILFLYLVIKYLSIYRKNSRKTTPVLLAIDDKGVEHVYMIEKEMISKIYTITTSKKKT